MTEALALFRPKKAINADLNLIEFIRFCKDDLTVFGADLDWDHWSWPGQIQFTKLGTHSKKATDSEVMAPPFIEFAKAYYRYQQGHKPTGTRNESKALRLIEGVLLESGSKACVSCLSFAHFDQAAYLARQHYSRSAAYHAGRELERLARFLSSNLLIEFDCGSWRNPISRPTDDRCRTGGRARKKRESNLPSQTAIDALAEIFANRPTHPRDVFTSSVFAMLLCAPSRVSEILNLRVGCEVFDTDKNGKEVYGWGFRAGKDVGGDIKWIPSEMVPTAKEAFARVRALTEPARELAKWVEQGNDRFFRHSEFPDVADSEPMSDLDAAKALGLRAKSNWAASNALRRNRFFVRNTQFTPDSLWVEVCRRQPDSLPWFDPDGLVKYSQALFCMTRNLLHGQRGTSPVILWRPTNNTVIDDLRGKPSQKNIFVRNGYANEDGSPIVLRTGQARHLLNTIAQRGGLSQWEIAKWSGRKETNQNRVYNHMTDDEMVARASAVLSESPTDFLPKTLQSGAPISEEEFERLRSGATHVTEFGVCIHDFAMRPCERFRDCLNCGNQVCIKGDEAVLDRLKRRLSQVEYQVSDSHGAVERDVAGADRWYEYHVSVLARVRELLSILEDPEIEDGAIVRLRLPTDTSFVSRAIRASRDKNALGGGEHENARLE